MEGSGRRPPDFYPVAAFYRQLVQALERAPGEQRVLAVVVLQLPVHWPRDDPDRRAVEIALRLDLRQEDLPTRLAARMVAVALPNTGEGGRVVATRLEALLSRLANGPVTAGMAFFPLDGSTAFELLCVATERSLRGLPGRPWDPELERLLGPPASKVSAPRARAW